MRHIPSGTTAELSILPFYEALERAQMPNDAYDVEKWLYVPNIYADYRYILGTRGKKPLICIGINPSTAQPNALDRTLQSVERIALGNGFDSFLMFNVYPQRATDPNTMEHACNEALRRENVEAFSYCVSLAKPACVWAAWGTIIEKRDYLAACLHDLVEAGQALGAQWYCAGQASKQGHPHHPLYLRKDEKLKPFDVAAYLAALGGAK